MELRDVLAMVRRRKWMVAAVTVFITGLAAYYSYTRGPIYVSEARVLVRPTLTSLSNNQQPVSLDTEVQLVTSAAVANVAKQLLNSPLEVQKLMTHVSVIAPVNTEILDISYSDTNRLRAQRGAQAFADAYLEFKKRQALDTITGYTATIQLTIQSLDKQIAALDRRISSLPRGSVALSDALNRRDGLSATRLSLQTSFASLSTLSVDPGQVIQPAQLPTSPSSPKHKLDLAIGVFLGLLVGIGFASVHERVHDKILGSRELEQCLDAPVLGVIPKMPGLASMSSWLITVERPGGDQAEAFRTLRTNFLAANGHHPLANTVLVTSAGPGEGKTTTAANLATSLAHLGKQVTLISADLRHPRVHKFFDVPNDPGLGQVLSGEVDLAKALRNSRIPNLQILPSGPVTNIMEPVELLQSDRMSEVLEQCSGAEFILIDGPSVLAVADSLALAKIVDGVLVVANARKGKRALVVQARYQLRQVGGHLIGGVLNGSKDSKMGVIHASRHSLRGLFHRLLDAEQPRDGDSKKKPTAGLDSRPDAVKAGGAKGPGAASVSRPAGTEPPGRGPEPSPAGTRPRGTAAGPGPAETQPRETLHTQGGNKSTPPHRRRRRR